MSYLASSGLSRHLKSLCSMSSNAHLQFVVFRLEGQRYALPLPAVERIVRAVELTPLPSSPRMVLGVMNLAGRLLPVVSLRRRFGLDDRRVSPADQFLIVQTAARALALVMDEVEEVISYPESSIVPADTIVPGAPHVHGVVTLGDGLVLIHDLERCLSGEDERSLASALVGKAGT